MIYKHPIDKVVNLTGVSIKISLTCEASVNSSYGWKRLGSNLPLNTAGMNTSGLSFINVIIENTGYYQCVATNGSGSSYSNFAYVSINGESACMCDYFNIITRLSFNVVAILLFFFILTHTYL